MGQAGSHAPPPQRGRRAHTLPHDPPRLAPKVLPTLCESPRLRSTDNGAILHSGGTISGRRPNTIHDNVPHGHVHANVYRSRSAGTSGENTDIRTRERDPLHRSHTNLELRHDGSSMNNRFGSEPDLRIEEEQKTRNGNKHFRKKYRAPPPPTNDNFEGSSPDSSEGNARPEPQRKLRLFKTRNETKKLNGQENLQFRNSYHEYKSLDMTDNAAFERRYRSPCKDKEQHLKYPDNKDMVQSTASLKREERLIQTKQDYRKTRIDRMSGCRAKTSKNEHSEAWKTPLLNRNFRYSERFKKDDNELPALRRERTFDETLIASERESESSRAAHEGRMKAIAEQLRGGKPTPLAETNKPLRKSLPSLLAKNNEEKDEFQAELKKATSRIRNQLGSKVNDSETKTSQEKNDLRSPTKIPSKVKKSSPSVATKTEAKVVSRRPFSRTNEDKARQTSNVVSAKKLDNKYKASSKENSRPMPDRGQASGKESTPEHSPTRKLESLIKSNQSSQEKQKQAAPSKQFYFGMIESKQTDTNDHLKDFPGLGSPIIEEISNFHLIEQKLLNYQEDESEFDKFNEKLKEESKTKNLSSESALSSGGSVESDSSLGIALRLRPTLPKKQRCVPRFSPAAAWRQLACLDDHLAAAETQPLAVETKMTGDISAESSPRSDQSADKSGDSGISGDHMHSDHRIDSPPTHHVHTQDSGPAAWTPQQDLGDSSSDGAGGAPALLGSGLATYSPGHQPFSLSLPRDQDRFKAMSCFYDCFQGKQLQQGFNSLQKLRKSVSGALGAALGSRRFDLEHEPMLEEPEQNWFLTKSAPNSLSNPLLFQQPARAKGSEEDAIKEESLPASEKEELGTWRAGTSYLSWGGHVMYLPPAPAAEQPLSMLGPIDRPVRSKSSGCLEASARAARAGLCAEMRERERSASPDLARALPARVLPANTRSSQAAGRGKRFTFQSTVRQLERRRLAEKLSKEADLKEQQRRTELEAMRRVEEEFQRKRAREKANIRQQLRLVSGVNSMPTPPPQHNKSRDSPDGSCRASPAPERPRDSQRHSNASSEISARSKSTTPIRSVELSAWRTGCEARVYRDWAAAREHPPACAHMPRATHTIYNGGGSAGSGEAFSGSPRSDNYRLEFARGRPPSPRAASPRTPRAPRLLRVRQPSSSGSDLSLRQPIKISEPTKEEAEPEEPAIVPTLRPAGPPRTPLLTH
ncbi:uncharacterized protein LOC110381702 isoform X3 [Helicoverpa armigera]|uniref:uncharacterized protein LOC110381702 isoform X3 n=1 Tax=Helicoverpa armigera TaxID=29058 RepID=UPI00308312A9